MDEKNTFKLLKDDDMPTTVEECQALIRSLYATIKDLFKIVEKLELENKQLREKLNNNSSNSSLPPSSDLKKKKKNQKVPSKNNSGAQKGHKGHFRNLTGLSPFNSLTVIPAKAQSAASRDLC